MSSSSFLLERLLAHPAHPSFAVYSLGISSEFQTACIQPASAAPASILLPSSLTHYLFLLQSRFRKLVCAKPLFSVLLGPPLSTARCQPQVRPGGSGPLSEGHSERMAGGHGRGPAFIGRELWPLASPASFFPLSLLLPTHLIFFFPLARKELPLFPKWVTCESGL